MYQIGNLGRWDSIPQAAAVVYDHQCGNSEQESGAG